MKGFRPEQFASLHPGRALGRKLTLRVEDVMVGEGYPSLSDRALMRETVVPIAEKRGTVPVVDGAGQVVGVVTAGDLTRLMEHDESWAKRPVTDVMTRDPRTARVGELGSAAVHRMEQGPGGSWPFLWWTKEETSWEWCTYTTCSGQGRYNIAGQ